MVQPKSKSNKKTSVVSKKAQKQVQKKTLTNGNNKDSTPESTEEAGPSSSNTHVHLTTSSSNHEDATSINSSNSTNASATVNGEHVAEAVLNEENASHDENVESTEKPDKPKPKSKATKGRPKSKATEEKSEQMEDQHATETKVTASNKTRKRKNQTETATAKSKADAAKKESSEPEEAEDEPAPKKTLKTVVQAEKIVKVTKATKRTNKDVEPSTSSKMKKQKISLTVPALSSISGTVFVVGQNDVGQLGFGEEIEMKRRPVMLELPHNIALPHSIADIAAGGMHSVCLTKTGEVITFGCNDEGALGRVTSEEGSEYIPRKVELPERVVQISAGDSHSAALTETGKVYVWGNFRNNEGQMGLTPDGSRQVKPLRILNRITIVKICSGVEHVACLSTEGLLYTFGCGQNGQLGRFSARNSKDGGRRGLSALLEPDVVPILLSSKPLFVEDIWAGSYTTFVKTRDSGLMFAFGLNNYNQLGIANKENENVVYKPKKLASFSIKEWLQIAGGQHHTLTLDTEGKVYALGREDYGRLGLGENCNGTTVPTLIPTLESETCNTISCGNCISLSTTEDGSVYSWGMGTNYQLGHGNEDDCHIPMKIGGTFAESWKAYKVSGGGQHTLILACPKGGKK